MNTPDHLNLETVLDFFRGTGTSVAVEIRKQFDQWVDELQAAGQEVDEQLVETVRHDLDVHHRLTPETILGGLHAPYISLNHTEAQHFGRE